MKKIVITLIGILIAVYAALAAVTAGDTEYAAEKMLYKVNKTLHKIAANPEVVPPAMLASAKTGLTEITRKYPKTNAAKTAYISLANVYMVDKKFDKAVETLDRALHAYGDDEIGLSNVYFFKGYAYEMRGDWDKALEVYKELFKEKYQNTPIGIQMPMYIANHYLRLNQKTKADEAYRHAAMLYEGVAEENKENMLGYAASNLLVHAYIGAGEYEKAGKILEGIVNEYPFTVGLLEQVPYIEALFLKKLNDPEKAAELLGRIADKVKDKKLRDALLGRIEKIRQQAAL